MRYTALACLTVLLAGMTASLWTMRRSGEPPPDEARLARIQAGRELFRHKWTARDPLSRGDGLGPVHNATSCVACHSRGGEGGSGRLDANVTTFSVRNKGFLIFPGKVREGIVHGYSTLERSETIADVHGDLPPIPRPPLNLLLAATRGNSTRLKLPDGIHLSQRNATALFGAGLIDKISDDVILTAARRREQLASNNRRKALFGRGRAARLADNKVGRFGWKGQSASLASFVRAACANELGLGNSGQAQPNPLFKPNYQTPGLDLTDEQCDQLTDFVTALPRPRERLPSDRVAAEQAIAGKQVFSNIGCADCHTADLGHINGLYSDMLLHDMGPELSGDGSYNAPSGILATQKIPGGAVASEWRTPPLWGVADSAPYLHDGRAGTLREAILLHGGEAGPASTRFAGLNAADQARLLAFLGTLRAPAAVRSRLGGN